MASSQDGPDRSTYIGGPDAAAIMGEHPYKSPLDVYTEKTGNPVPFEANAAMQAGKLLETWLCDCACEAMETSHGITLARNNEGGYALPLGHDDAFASLSPHIGGHADRLVVTEGGELVLVEAKCVFSFGSAARWGEDMSGVMPPEHVIQTHYYAHILGAEQAFIAAFIMGEVKVIKLELDRDLQKAIRTAVEAFWRDHVVPRVPPPATHRDAKTLEHLHPENDGNLLDGAPCADHIAAYQDAREQAKAAKQAQDEAGNLIKQFIGDADGIVIDGGKPVTWKANKNGKRALRVP